MPTWMMVNPVDDELATDDRTGRATARREWIVEAAEVISGDDALAASLGGDAIPAALEAYSAGRPNLLVIGRTAEFISPRQRRVIVNYEDLTDGSGEQDLLSQAARITTTEETVADEYKVDAEGQPVATAAGEPFDKGPTRLAGIRVYHIEKFVTATVRTQILAANYTNNDSPKVISGIFHDTDTLFQASSHFESVGSIFKARIVIKYNPHGWTDRGLHAGFRELVDGTMVEIRVKAKESEPEVDGWVPVARPWPLNPDGSKKADGEPFDELEFFPYELDPWAGVPLS